MPIYWELKEFLDRHDIKALRLAKDSGMSQTTVYKLVNRNRRVNRFDSDTMDKILTTLSGYTGEVVRHEHILRFVPPEEPK